MIHIVIASYATVERLNMVINWGCVLIPLLLAIRCFRDVTIAQSEPETVGLKGALKKCKKRIAACIIAITISSTIAFIKKFYT